ncbi:MAG: beta-galactosidase [Verrucomicrobia bacterium]|nr:beta-galactosidase [Verrucomicrobiota bacterium]
MTSPAKDCLLGVDYFPEHWPRERWQRDVALMKECGLQVVRIAEFSWSKTQPTSEVWNWNWLDEAVAVIADAGLKVILCTPSACPPPWFVQEYPDVLPVLADGKSMTLGHRRHYSPHHAAYRSACRDFATQMARRYGRHPAVIGFQIDNELHGLMEDTGPLAQRAFQAWLQQRHGSLADLDHNLGLIFWGQQYSNWSQIPVPVSGMYHPSLRTEWRRFVSAAWIDFCKLQADAMRPLIGDRVLTTNCFLHRWGMPIDWHSLMRNGGLDLFSFDNYSNELHENGYYNNLAASLSPVYWCLEQRCGDTQHNHILARA